MRWQNGAMETANIREWATDAIRYWEAMRILFNLILSAIVIAYFVVDLPASKASMKLNSALFLFLLAVLANVAYCAAYVVEIFAQVSAFRELWQRYRWLLFAIGVAFAGILTRFRSLAFFGSEH